MTLNSILNRIPIIKKIPPERINDIRLVVGGHIVYLLIGGIYRGLPVLQDELIIHFSRNETNLLGKEFQPSPLLHNDTSYHVQTRISTKIASFTTVIMLGHMITGFFSGFYLNKIGVRWITAVVGLLQALGYWFVALTLPNDNIFLTESILFVFNGLSGGLALAAATSSAKYSASKDRMGFVLTVQCCGLSTAAVVLPFLFNLFKRWFSRACFVDDNGNYLDESIKHIFQQPICPTRGTLAHTFEMCCLSSLQNTFYAIAVTFFVFMGIAAVFLIEKPERGKEDSDDEDEAQAEKLLNSGVNKSRVKNGKTKSGSDPNSGLKPNSFLEPKTDLNRSQSEEQICQAQNMQIQNTNRSYSGSENGKANSLPAYFRQPKEFKSSKQSNLNNATKKSMVTDFFKKNIYTYHNAFSNTKVALLCVSTFLFMTGYISMIQNYQSLVSSFNLGGVGGFLITYVGIIECISRMIYAWLLVDKFPKLNLLVITFFGDSFAHCLCLFSFILPTYEIIPLIVMFTLAGFFNAGFSGLILAVLEKISTNNSIKDDTFNAALGIYMLFKGLGETIGPVIGGGIIDAVSFCPKEFKLDDDSCQRGMVQRPYWVVFAFGSSCMFLASAFVFAMRHTRNH